MRRWPLHLCLTTRRFGRASALIGLIAICIAFAVSSHFGYEGRSGTITPIVLILPVALGAAVGFASGSVSPDIERLAGPQLAWTVRAMVLLLTLMCVMAAGIAVLVGAQSIDPVWVTSAVVCMRVTVFFVGIALISAFVAGHYYCWTGPIMVIPVVTYFGVTYDCQYYAWNPFLMERSAPLAWAVSVAACVVGLALTSDSISRVRQRVRRRRAGSSH